MLSICICLLILFLKHLIRLSSARAFVRMWAHLSYLQWMASWGGGMRRSYSILLIDGSVCLSLDRFSRTLWHIVWQT